MEPTQYANYGPNRLELSMNSKSIWSRCIPAYDRHFDNCEIVTSAPGVFFWAGEHIVLRGGLSICQHVPLRVYVGLEPLRYSHEVMLGDHYVYDPLSDTFRKIVDPVEFNPSALIEEINRSCDFYQLKKTSFKIRVLSELRPAAGCNWSGAFATALATAILLHNDRINADNINRWKNIPAPNLSSDKFFSLCNVFSWHIETILHTGSASGYGTFTSLIDSKQPIVFFTEKRGEPNCPPINVMADPSWQKRPSLLESMRYGGFRFREKLCEEEDSDYPIMLGLVYSGVPKNTGRRIGISGKIASSLEESRENLLNIFRTDPDILKQLGPKRPLFMDICSDSDGERMLSNHYSSLATSGIEVLNLLRVLLSSGIDGKGFPLTDLARSVCGIQGNLIQIGQGWYLGDQICTRIKKVAEEGGVEDRCGIKMTGGGGGGMVFFFMPLEGKGKRNLQDDLIEMIPSLQHIHPEINVDWLSTIDMLEKDGIRIEKPLRQVDKRFEPIPDKSIPLIRIRHNKLIKERIYKTDLNTVRETGDLVLDFLPYYKGTPEYPLVRGQQVKTMSREYSLFFLRRLFRSEDLSLNYDDITELNHELGIEGYGISDIKSRLITPVIEAVHEIAGKRTFEITCTGKDGGRIAVDFGDADVFLIDRE